MFLHTPDVTVGYYCHTDKTVKYLAVDKLTVSFCQFELVPDSNILVITWAQSFFFEGVEVAQEKNQNIETATNAKLNKYAETNPESEP